MIGLSPPAAVQGHLDALHPRVLGGLLDERLRAAGEALVGVVHEDRPVAHHRHQRAVGLLGHGDPAGGDRRPRPVLEVGAVDVVELPEEPEVDRGPAAVDVGRVQLQLANEGVEHLVAHVVGHLEAHRLVEAPAAQLHLHRLEEVLGLFLLEGEVGVAGHPEHRRLLDHHPGEQRVEVGEDQLLDRQEPRRVDLDQPREHGRHLDPGEPAVVALGVRVRDHRRDARGEVGDVRERVARVDGERGEHGEDALLVDLRHPLAVGDVEVVPADDRHPGGGQSRGPGRPGTPAPGGRRARVHAR